jgi:hypothetical protein
VRRRDTVTRLRRSQGRPLRTPGPAERSAADHEAPEDVEPGAERVGGRLGRVDLVEVGRDLIARVSAPALRAPRKGACGRMTKFAPGGER